MKKAFLLTAIVLIIQLAYHFPIKSETPSDPKIVFAARLHAVHNNVFSPLDQYIQTSNRRFSCRRHAPANISPSTEIQAIRKDISGLVGEQRNIISGLCVILNDASLKRESIIKLLISNEEMEYPIIQGGHESEEDIRAFFRTTILRNWSEYVDAEKPQSGKLLKQLKSIEARDQKRFSCSTAGIPGYSGLLLTTKH